MPNRWNVTLNGREHMITVDHSDTGKDVVRVDGRTVARPLSLDEQERVFTFEGHQYSIHRSGENFECAAVGKVYQTDRTRTMPPAGITVHAPASVGIDRRMTRVTKYWWIGVIAAVLVMFYWAMPSYTTEAKQRVEVMLGDLKDGSGRESSIGVGMWARNVRTMDSGELSAADNQFTRWRQQKNFFFDKGFKSYKVVSSKKVNGEVPTALVTFEVDGQAYKVIVPQRRPMSWAE